MKVKHQSDGEESVGDALPGTQMTLLATRLCEYESFIEKDIRPHVICTQDDVALWKA
jgi:hypothetical protein